MYEALRKGATVEELNSLTKIKAYFIEQMKELVEEENEILSTRAASCPPIC
jgi:carbamoyl-phosphate synthase large subunit